MQVSYLVYEHFQDDRGFLRSSALAYTTVLALVPLLAFVFAILKGLGAEEQMKRYLIDVSQHAQAVGVELAASQGGSGQSITIESTATETRSGRTATLESSATGMSEDGRTVAVESTARAAVIESTSAESAAPVGGSATTGRSGVRLLYRITGGRPEVAERIMTYVEQTNFTTLGIFGLAILLWTVVNVLGTMETTFNDIWGVKVGRTWLRKFSDYTAVMVIAPVSFVTAMGVATYLVSTSERVTGVEAVLSPVVRVIGWVAPVVLVWLAFSVFYAFMPNTRVGFVPAVTGGIVGGTLWQLAFWGYTTLNIGVARYNAIYTSFAALPIFLAWLYFSWVIVIAGAEFAFATGHIHSYRRSRRDIDLSPNARELVALRVFLEIARSFRTAEDAPTDEQLADRSRIPPKTVLDIIGVLRDAKLVIEVANTGIPSFKPASDLALITPNDVLTAVRCAGDEPPRRGEEEDALWREALELHSQISHSMAGGEMGRSFEGSAR